jgi:hypothetical protein
MTAALTPPLALDYVTALSADIRAAVVLDPEGALLAGPEALVGPARQLIAAVPDDARQLEGKTAEGAVYAARDARHTILVVTGRFALARLTRHDLNQALSALGGESRSEEAPAPVPDAAVRALFAAIGEDFRRPRAVSRSDCSP